MKKIVLIGSIVSVVIVIIVIIWALIAGAGFLWEQFPVWIAEGGKKYILTLSLILGLKHLILYSLQETERVCMRP